MVKIREYINNINRKNAYSLLEVCVVMVIVVIFIILMANVIPHRVKAKTSSEAHGRFECYWVGNRLFQQQFTENSTSGLEEATLTITNSAGENAKACEFTPPAWAKYLIIDAVGGGAGGSNVSGGAEGRFVSTFYATIAPKYYAIPGKAGSANNHGKDTEVQEANYVKIVTAPGGRATSVIENTTIDDIQSCAITEAAGGDYDCNIYPYCEIKDKKIKVSFCRSKEAYVTKEISYQGYDVHGNLVTGNPRFVINNNTKITHKKATDPNVWVYHDISLWSDYSNDENPIWDSSWVPNVNDPYTPSLYTMELTMDTHVTAASGGQSNLDRYIKSMEYSSGISTANVGNGGSKNASGHAGAVLFMW